jgi:hypothetical protein
MAKKKGKKNKAFGKCMRSEMKGGSDFITARKACITKMKAPAGKKAKAEKKAK